MIQVVSGKENNEKGPTFKVGDHVGISKCKNIFAKLYVPNWLQEVFAITKVKNSMPWTYVINDLNDLPECFTKKKYKEQIKKSSE